MDFVLRETRFSCSNAVWLALTIFEDIRTFILMPKIKINILNVMASHLSAITFSHVVFSRIIDLIAGYFYFQRNLAKMMTTISSNVYFVIIILKFKTIVR